MQIWRNAIIKPRIESGGYSARVNLISANNPEVNPLRLSTKFIRSDRRWRRGRELSRRSSFANSVVQARAYIIISKVLHESTRIRPARLHCKLSTRYSSQWDGLEGNWSYGLKWSIPSRYRCSSLSNTRIPECTYLVKLFRLHEILTCLTGVKFWCTFISLFRMHFSLFIYIKIKIIAITL